MNARRGYAPHRAHEAAAAYRQAIKQTRNIAEWLHLHTRLRRLLASP